MRIKGMYNSIYGMSVTNNIRSGKYWKYKIIEYEYKKIAYGESGKAIEVCKTLHKTNSKLVFWLIILCLKIQGIKYDVVKD